MTQNRTKDTLVLGFAMFAIFFGAGNLIFPPPSGSTPEPMSSPAFWG